MPTKRLNISLTGENVIDELIKLRKELQIAADREEISFADIVKVLIITRPSNRIIISALS